MDTKELTEYCKKLLDLESEIFLNNSVLPEIKNKSNYTPCRPTRPKFVEPVEPKMPEKSAQEKKKHKESVAGLVVGIFGTLSVVVFLLIFEISDFLEIFMLLFLLFMSIGLIMAGRSSIEDEKAKNKEKLEKYKEELEKYNNKEYEKLHQNKVNKYKEDLKTYTEIVAEQSALREQCRLIENCGKNLQRSLVCMYSLGVIYPKYRNFIAMSAIYEYLSSGRCNCLEGNNGAYNLYEQELRQNIIIGQLSIIINNLEQIRNNQYVLYNEISKSNQRKIEILNNCYDGIQLTEYCSEMNAKNTAALAYFNSRR